MVVGNVYTVSLKINHPESVFVPINGLHSNDIAETQTNNL